MWLITRVAALTALVAAACLPSSGEAKARTARTAANNLRQGGGPLSASTGICGCSTCPCKTDCGCNICPCVSSYKRPMIVDKLPRSSCGCDVCPCAKDGILVTTSSSTSAATSNCGCSVCPCLLHTPSIVGKLSKSDLGDCGCAVCPCVSDSIVIPSAPASPCTCMGKVGCGCSGEVELDSILGAFPHHQLTCGCPTCPCTATHLQTSGCGCESCPCGGTRTSFDGSPLPLLPETAGHNIATKCGCSVCPCQTDCGCSACPCIDGPAKVTADCGCIVCPCTVATQTATVVSSLRGQPSASCGCDICPCPTRREGPITVSETMGCGCAVCPCAKAEVATSTLTTTTMGAVGERSSSADVSRLQAQLVKATKDAKNQRAAAAAAFRKLKAQLREAKADEKQARREAAQAQNQAKIDVAQARQKAAARLTRQLDNFEKKAGAELKDLRREDLSEEKVQVAVEKASGKEKLDKAKAKIAMLVTKATEAAKIFHQVVAQRDEAMAEAEVGAKKVETLTFKVERLSGEVAAAQTAAQQLALVAEAANNITEAGCPHCPEPGLDWEGEDVGNFTTEGSGASGLAALGYDESAMTMADVMLGPQGLEDSKSEKSAAEDLAVAAQIGDGKGGVLQLEADIAPSEAADVDTSSHRH